MGFGANGFADSLIISSAFERGDDASWRETRFPETGSRYDSRMAFSTSFLNSNSVTLLREIRRTNERWLHVCEEKETLCNFNF